MTEEEFLGYEYEDEAPAVIEEVEEKNFFATIAKNPRIPIFAFLGLIALVAFSFLIASTFSGSEDLDQSAALHQPAEETQNNQIIESTPEPGAVPVPSLPEDTTSNTTTELVEELTPPEEPIIEEEVPEATNAIAEEEVVAQPPKEKEEKELEPEYKVVTVDHKEPAPPKEEKVVEETTTDTNTTTSQPATVNSEPPSQPIITEKTGELPIGADRVELSESTSTETSAYDNVYNSGNYRKLTPNLMSELIKSIDYRFQKIGKKNNSCIEMNALSGNDRALSYAKEIQSFLRGQGYDVSSAIKQVRLSNPVQDVWVWFNSDCVSLTVGTPKNSQ